MTIFTDKNSKKKNRIEMIIPEAKNENARFTDVIIPSYTKVARKKKTAKYRRYYEPRILEIRENSHNLYRHREIGAVSFYSIEIKLCKTCIISCFNFSCLHS